MFKVGDKGKTRGGLDYEIIGIDLDHGAGWPLMVALSNAPHGTDSFVGKYDDYAMDGSWLYPCSDEPLDLMPPDNHEEVEMPQCEYSGEDDYAPEFDMSELVQIAAQAARDNPDLLIVLDPQVGVIHFRA